MFGVENYFKFIKSFYLNQFITIVYKRYKTNKLLITITNCNRLVTSSANDCEYRLQTSEIFASKKQTIDLPC